MNDIGLTGRRVKVPLTDKEVQDILLDTENINYDPYYQARSFAYTILNKMAEKGLIEELNNDE